MRSCISLSAFVAVWLAILGVTHAQNLPSPKIVRVLPTGGKAGSIFEVTVAGTDLTDVETLHFSFPGVKVELLDATKLIPMPTKGKGTTKGMATVSASSAQLFKVTLPPNAPLGIHDVRVITKNGISNPRAFVVGELNEVEEKGTPTTRRSRRAAIEADRHFWASSTKQPTWTTSVSPGRRANGSSSRA
ncbi:MAG: hypothetical protein U0744_05325 [Gemmataceae bacterium]